MTARSRSLGRALALYVGVGLLTAMGGAGCNLIEVAFSSASIDSMVPGGNVASGKLDCWLTIEFENTPSGIDPRDVLVRFDSVALARPAEFDWAFIAAHDRIAKGEGFGSGYRSNDATSANTDPPIGQPLKVQFPLEARSSIANAPSTLWLEAELYWGGKRQGSMRRTIDHVYSAL